ncbi:NLP-like protein [Plasmopara halstedii]|uniref:NLP-like protein n=1 Tax=Plasmopara halstedii TaxID=4781 RepID=A0A0P1B2Q9_PLAHL|nr:NLP-like protein [Plasmopara halstedii]CEG48336.1 NLP-like protein [Plasmopara halstedii]|eukprot:XP_024584705.1 NLP-like protein [Plasmopara halstedii]
MSIGLLFRVLIACIITIQAQKSSLPNSDDNIIPSKFHAGVTDWSILSPDTHDPRRLENKGGSKSEIIDDDVTPELQVSVYGSKHTAESTVLTKDKVNSTENNIKRTIASNSSRETQFSDQLFILSGQTVASLTIQSGKHINAVSLLISLPVKKVFNHGGNEGVSKTLTLGIGEHITSTEAHWGKLEGRTHLFYVRFNTSMGNSIAGGTKTKTQRIVKAPKGYQLGGFFGHAGNEIIHLGVIWTSILFIAPNPTTLASSPTPWIQKTMRHDKVVPFKQPKPVTVAEHAAVKFKPQINIVNGCHPYPAVNATGEISGGLKASGSSDAGCKGSEYGSQVYGRSTWHRGLWAIMYSWYFPKDTAFPLLGHRHDWEHIIVWIDNPSLYKPRILAVASSAHSWYTVQSPPHTDRVNGTSVKVKYAGIWPLNHALTSTTKSGEYQDLIMWEQLTEAARQSLQQANFGMANVPMRDGNFLDKLDTAWSFARLRIQT